MAIAAATRRHVRDTVNAMIALALQGGFWSADGADWHEKLWGDMPVPANDAAEREYIALVDEYLCRGAAYVARQIVARKVAANIAAQGVCDLYAHCSFAEGEQG